MPWVTKPIANVPPGTLKKCCIILDWFEIHCGHPVLWLAKIFSTSSIVNTFVYLYIYTSWNGINVYCSQNLSFLLITIWRLLLAYHYGSLIRPFLKKFCPFFTWHISSKCLYVQLVLHFKFEFFKTLHVSLLIYIISLWQFNWTFLNNLIWFEYCNPIGWSAWRKFWLYLITWVDIVTSPTYSFANDKFK